MGRAPYPVSDHCDGRRFFNPSGAKAGSLLDVLRWKLTSRAAKWSFSSESRCTVPPRALERGLVRATFVNHSTVLIQLPGCNILTDPIFSPRAGPFFWTGPRRRRPPGVLLEDLPPIDLLLLSHDHYDHLDLPSFRRIAEKFRPRIVTGLGIARRLGAMEAVELDWWQNIDIAGQRITATPATHFSGRGLADRDRTLWCGFAIETAAGPIYFAGDTAFTGTPFRAIRERLGRPMLALLPIGAYLPRWFMSPVHMSPSEAVEAHAALGAKLSIAIHFGTFQLDDAGEFEPVEDLQAALARRGELPPFLALDHGEAHTIMD